MAHWFQKKPDRLQEEINNLEKERQRLRKQASLLEKQLTQPVRHEEKEITRVAKFRIDPQASSRSSDTRKKKKLRVHQRKLRNRLIFLCGVLAVLALVLWRLIS